MAHYERSGTPVATIRNRSPDATATGVSTGRPFTQGNWNLGENSSMLVLSRRSGECIRIGDNITVEVRRVAGNRVTLALQAPRDIRILRGEVEKAAKAFEPPAGSDTSGVTAIVPDPPAVRPHSPTHT